MRQVDLRGLSLAECEKKIAAMITSQIEEDLLRYEVDFIGSGVSTDERLARVALERARLMVVRDNLIGQFHDFVRIRVLA
jgi:hypothetical protein